MVAIKMRADGKRTASDGQVRRALSELSDADYARIERSARARAAGLGSFEWKDLYQEAIERILAGKRKWPLELDFTVFVIETMRSVASEIRKRLVHGPIRAEADLGSNDPHLDSFHDEQPGSERAVLARDVFEQILRHFQRDPAVLNLIAGIAVGETARETIDRTGMSEAEFDAARKRFRRGMPEGLDPKGMRP
jgi:DNA-directed RNA polymerase specialized sigma24 family protein